MWQSLWKLISPTESSENRLQPWQLTAFPSLWIPEVCVNLGLLLKEQLNFKTLWWASRDIFQQIIGLFYLVAALLFGSAKFNLEIVGSKEALYKTKQRMPKWAQKGWCSQLNQMKFYKLTSTTMVPSVSMPKAQASARASRTPWLCGIQAPGQE